MRKIALLITAFSLSVYALSQSNETIVFDAFVKSEYKEWKGFTNYKNAAARKAILQRLKEVYIIDKELTKIPNELFECTNLERINLSHNQLIQIPDELFGLPKLISIDLSNNKLTQLPNKLSECRNLKNIDLSNNRLIQIPASIERFPNLKTLALAHNNIKELPKEITSLKELNELRIYGNIEIDVVKLAVYFKNFEKNITISNFADAGNEDDKVLAIFISNKLNPIPAEIFAIKNLTGIIFNYYGLNSLPDEICIAQNLKEVYIQLNKFETFPKQLLCLKNLTKLNIGFNSLIEIPNEITKLKNLKYLMLDGNKNLDFSNILDLYKSSDKEILFGTSYMDDTEDTSKLFIVLPKEVAYEMMKKASDDAKNTYRWSVKNLYECINKKDIELASKIRQKLDTTGVSFFTYNDLADQFLKINDSDGAYWAIGHSINVSKDLLKPHSLLGIYYLYEGKYEDAREHYLKYSDSQKGKKMFLSDIEQFKSYNDKLKSDEVSKIIKLLNEK